MPRSEHRHPGGVGSVVRRARAKASIGVSQEELGARAELHRTYVSSIERGERNVSLVNIERLADALEIEISDFFG